MKKAEIIDVHAHAILPTWVSEMRRSGKVFSDGSVSLEGIKLAEWCPDMTIQVMDDHGIRASVLSLPQPLPDTRSSVEDTKLARVANEEFASIISSYPQRLGAFGVLPMRDVNASLIEARYALEELQLDGIGIFTNVDGRHPGDSNFEKLYEYLDNRAAVVFMHPNTPYEYNGDLNPATMEFMFESARALTSLVYSGMKQKYPNIKFISTHGGGVLPYIVTRISGHAETLNVAHCRVSAEQARTDFSTFHFDLTAAAHDAAIGSLRCLAPSGQWLSGFDCPVRSTRGMEIDIDYIEHSTFLTDDERQAIFSRNAFKLFPRFAAATWAVEEAL